MASKQEKQPETLTVSVDDAGLETLFRKVVAASDPVSVKNVRTKLVLEALEAPNYVNAVDDALPSGLAGQGRRLARRAALTFGSDANLEKCPIDQFIKCVVLAAEMGLAIDGRLCYVVNFKGRWQVMPSYKGLVAVAKRSGQVLDVKADLVFVDDDFSYRHEDGKDHLNHKPRFDSANRKPIMANIKAAYACFVLAGGLIRYCVMTRDDLEKIRETAPSKGGPWSTWLEEMVRKCPIRRGLKLYCDDPGVLAALEVEDELSTPEPREPHPLPEGKLDLSKKKTKPEKAREPGEEGD